MGATGPAAGGSIRLLSLGVFSSGARILVARGRDPATGEPFHRPLGGGIEFGERAADALRREIREELGAEIDEPRLLGVLENLFEYDGRARHEIVFVFDARFRDPSLAGVEEIVIAEAGTGWEPARWLALPELADGSTRLVPQGLLEMLESTLHAG